MTSVRSSFHDSSSYGTQSQYSDGRFASAEGNLGDFPYPPYSELPTFSGRRRRRNNSNDVVKWAMRAVLASPVIVLCLWSIGALLFANKHSSVNTNQQLQQQKRARLSPSATQPDLVLMGMSQQALQQPQQAVEFPQQEQQSFQQPMMMLQQPQITETAQQLEQGQAMLMTPVNQQEPTSKLLSKNNNKKQSQNRPNVNHRPMPRAPQQQQQVLYYDPKQATSENGKLQVPLTVYDLQGNPIPLQQLSGKQVFMEPPQQVKPTRRTLSTSDVKKWGESTAQDQSIIVATVAVMALLVGALSARRMRSRNILSACIENESLEDDVAYDTAYTTSHNKDSSYYNTFANGGWKGDLEKFDV